MTSHIARVNGSEVTNLPFLDLFLRRLRKLLHFEFEILNLPVFDGRRLYNVYLIVRQMEQRDSMRDAGDQSGFSPRMLHEKINC